MALWSSKELPKPPLTKEWSPKNPEVKEIKDFPFYPLPHGVTTHVNISCWSQQILEMKGNTGDKLHVPIMEKVYKDLAYGCDSRVRFPGTSATISPNYFPQPKIDIPRIADALASEVKAGNMAGPLETDHIKEAKVNGLVSVKKPDGSRRQVGNLSHPIGLSFNENIDPEVFGIWPVQQTTARQFSDMIVEAGPNCLMSCSDMVAAYKNLPVKREQWRLQVFEFWGKHFVDLKLIFGDRSACMWYDRFHHCVAWLLVWPKCKIPCSWVGITIDDLTSVSPEGAESFTTSFVAQYRETLRSLNFKATPDDPGERPLMGASRVRCWASF